MLWLTNNSRFDDEFIANSIEWFQKYDEWNIIVSRITDTEIDEIIIRNVEQASEYASRLKEISFEMVMSISFLKRKDTEDDPILNYAEKIFSVASIHFEDFIFVSNQFLDIVKDK